MKNPISIEESLKELNNEVLKNIRGYYKKGNNLNEIIQHHKTKKPEALSKIFNLIKFEFDEQERFLKTYETIDEINLFFFPLNQETYARIIDATLKGIRDGIENYLKKIKKELLYITRLSDLCYDNSVKDNIKLKLGNIDLYLLRKDIPAYSKDVGSRYSGFVFDESYKIFIKKFGSVKNFK